MLILNEPLLLGVAAVIFSLARLVRALRQA